MGPKRRLFSLPFRTRESIARDVDEELEFHIAMQARGYEAAGLSHEAALAKARAEFGDMERTRSYLNEVDRRVELTARAGQVLEEARQDIWLALRQAGRSPLVTLVAAGSLALGIGASAAIYSVVHGVLFAPLPYADQDRVVVLQQLDRAAGRPVHLAPLNFSDWKERARTLSHVAMAEPSGATLTTPTSAERLGAWRVTPGFFDALGATFVAGRGFLESEHGEGNDAFAVLSHAAWQRHFGGDPSVVGRGIMLDGRSHTVLGVLDARATFPAPSDVYLPRDIPRAGDNRANRVATYLRGVARIAPGATVATAREEAGRIAVELARIDPGANRQMGALVTPLHEHMTARVTTPLVVLLVAVMLVMLIASVNVGNLLLARGVGRRREMAVRAALGAGRGRLARQLLAEAAVLALIGLTAGLALGAAGTGVLRSVMPGDMPRLDDIRLGWPVMLFAAGLAVMAIGVTGLAPAWQYSRADAGSTLRESGSIAGRRRLPRSFIAAEVALTLMLLIGAGLLLRSHRELLNEELGFSPERTLAMTLHVWDDIPDPQQRVAFFNDLAARVAALPGVTAVSAANSLPLSREGSEMDPPFLVEGAPAVPRGQEPTAVLTIVTPQYFQAMGTPLLRGRGFEPRDDAGAARVVVINEALARQHFAGEDPIGRRLVAFSRDGQRITQEIIGVAANVRHERLDELPRPEIYAPLAQRSFGSMTLLVRHAMPGDAGLARAVQQQLAAIHPALLFDSVERLDERLAETLAPRRFVLALVAVFASIALALSLVGIYGAVSFAASQRTSEIGVRMALGARAEGVVLMLVREGLGVVAIGIAAGAAGAAALSGFIRGLLYEVSPLDPLTFGAITLLMLATAALAAWIPARRAAAVDPVSAIRS